MEKPTSIKLKRILPNKVVSIEVGSGFYARVQELLFSHINTVPTEVAINALNELKSREPKDKFEYHLITLMTLVYSIENSFNEAGFTQESDVAIPKS